MNKIQKACLLASAVIGLALAAAVLTSHSSAAAGTSPPSATPVAITAAAGMSGLAESATPLARGASTQANSQLSQLTDAANVPAGMQSPGTLVAGSARSLVTSASGGTTYSLYAASTDRGYVCGGLVDGPAGCFDGFRAKSPLVATAVVRSTGQIIVFGFVNDGVRAAALVTTNGSTPLEITNNGFVLTTNVDRNSVKGFDVHLARGAVFEPFSLSASN